MKSFIYTEILMLIGNIYIHNLLHFTVKYVLYTKIPPKSTYILIFTLTRLKSLRFWIYITGLDYIFSPKIESIRKLSLKIDPFTSKAVPDINISR